MVVALSAAGSVRHRVRLIAAALLALGLVWTLAPASSPPLYDGLGFPDEPYRFVSAPAGYQKTPAASTASYTVGYRPGAAEIYDVSSDELGPQVEVIVRQQDLTLPAGSGQLSLRAAPVPVTKQPVDGVVWGNAYRVSATAAGAGVALRPDGHTDQIRLRAPTGPPPTPAIEIYNGSTWRRLQATRIGNDLYVAYLTGVGDYALVTDAASARVSSAPGSGGPGSASAGSSGSSAAPIGADTAAKPVGSDTVDQPSTSSSTGRTLLIVLGAAVVACAALIVGVRLGRRQSPP